GIRPAISAGLSVSRVGGAAQTSAVKSVSGGLKLGLSQFRELASFAQFGSDLDAATKQQIDRGQRLTELLKQPQYQPMSVWQQTASISAVINGYFDEVPAAHIKDAQAALLTKLGSEHKKDVEELEKGGKPTEAIQKAIEKTAVSAAKGFEDK
ncbi:MAG: F0F1 ATP synthase subunit alpha, partial [Candidatus Microsaccharimonas sp.]